MYFLFVDGSGNTRIKHNVDGNGFYVLGGVIVHEKDWRIVEGKITKLKKELLPKLEPSEWELHAYDIWNIKKLISKLKLHLNFKKKKEIFSKTVEFVCKSPEIKLINIIVLKDKLQEKYAIPKAKEHSWKMMAEKFEHFLEQQQDKTTNNGLIFVDSDQKIPEKEIKSVLWNAVRYGTKTHKIHHVMEDPIFIESHLKNLMQLSDMIAYIIHRAYLDREEFKVWLEKLKPSMYQPDGNLALFGLKEFP